MVVEVVDVDDQATTLWQGSSRSGVGTATIPRGEILEPEHEHLASVIVNRAHPAEVDPTEEPLPLHQTIFARSRAS